jgi:hypothetical protein
VLGTGELKSVIKDWYKNLWGQFWAKRINFV